MQFSQILGKSEVKRQLIQQVQKDRIPHAQLFLAREGYGGLALALAFATYLMCEQKTETDSCGQCGQCLKTNKFIHPDIHFSFPVVKQGEKKREITTSDDYLPEWREILSQNPFMGLNEWMQQMDSDSQPNINVKECNDIIHKLNMMSYESDYKVLIMWLPEYLDKEGNRLLKLIEEPTDNTFIILVAENQNLVLKTILSRCQLIKVPKFENKEVSQYIIEKLELPISKGEQIANLADGNINLAMSIATDEAPDFSDLLISWLRIAYKSDPLEINKWISAVDGMTKNDQKNFLEYGLHFFNQFVFWMYTKSEEVNLTDKEKEIAGNMTKIINVTKAEAISAILDEAIVNLHRNANLKILLFADTLTIGDIVRGK
jgi:DNA polymerase-3 subunit delta'